MGERDAEARLLSPIWVALLMAWLCGVVVSATPTGVASGNGSVWWADDASDRIFRINSTTRNLLGQIPTHGGSPQGLAWDGAYLWVCDWGTDTIYRVNSTTGTITHQIPTPHTDCRGLAWDGAYLWVVESVTDTLYRLNPTTGGVIDSFPSSCSEPRGLAWDGAYLWVSDDDTGRILRCSTSGVTQGWIRGEGNHPYGIAWESPRYLWVVDPVLPQFYRLNTNSGLVLSSLALGSSDLRGITRDGAYIWYLDGATNTAHKITTSGESAFWFTTPGSNPQGITFDGTYLWISDSATDKIYKYNLYEATIWEFETPGAEPRGLAWDGEYLYNLDQAARKIYRINASTGRNISTINTPGGNSPQMLDYALGGLWVSEQDTEDLLRQHHHWDHYRELPGTPFQPRGSLCL